MYSSSSLRNSEAPPVIELTIRSAARSSLVVGALGPEGGRDDLALGVGEPHVAVGEGHSVGHLPDQDLELVGVPVVVLVGERDQLRLRRDCLQDALEVAVVAEPLLVALHPEAGIAADGVLDHRLDLGTARRRR